MDCVDTAGRTRAGCCWCWLLLLIVAAGCCCWLLLLVAAVDCCCWLLLLIAAQKVFEYFRDIVDDLRLRQICRRKSLWIFSGCWWLAAKTNLQAKKSLNIFGLLMICGQDKFAGEKVFEYFRVVDEESLNISRIWVKVRWKRVSPREVSSWR